jgi:hypothetical protein
MQIVMPRTSPVSGQTMGMCPPASSHASCCGPRGGAGIGDVCMMAIGVMLPPARPQQAKQSNPANLFLLQSSSKTRRSDLSPTESLGINSPGLTNIPAFGGFGLLWPPSDF